MLQNVNWLASVAVHAEEISREQVSQNWGDFELCFNPILNRDDRETEVLITQKHSG